MERKAETDITDTEKEKQTDRLESQIQWGCRTSNRLMEAERRLSSWCRPCPPSLPAPSGLVRFLCILLTNPASLKLTEGLLPDLKCTIQPTAPLRTLLLHKFDCTLEVQRHDNPNPSRLELLLIPSKAQYCPPSCVPRNVGATFGSSLSLSCYSQSALFLVSCVSDPSTFVHLLEVGSSHHPLSPGLQ